jgi:hypothetical protein
MWTINHMSFNLLSLHIIQKILKMLKFFYIWFTFNNISCLIFSFNNYSFKLNDQLNNTLFVFWEINIKYINWLAHYVLNFNIFFHMITTTFFHLHYFIWPYEIIKLYLFYNYIILHECLKPYKYIYFDIYTILNDI